MFILFGVGLHLHCSVVGFREGKEKCVKERVERCNGFAMDIAETPKGLECACKHLSLTLEHPFSRDVHNLEEFTSLATVSSFTTTPHTYVNFLKKRFNPCKKRSWF